MQSHSGPLALSRTSASILPAPKPSDEWALLYPANKSQLTRLRRSYRENEKYKVVFNVDKKDGDDIFKQCTDTLKQHPNNASALSMLAWCHITGAGTPVSFEKSIDLYKQAAEKGSSIAKNNLAMINIIHSLQMDRVVPLTKAVDELRQLTIMTPLVLPAIYNYTRCLDEACGVEEDSIQAELLLSKIADLNYAPAQNSLALGFEDKDKKKYHQYIKKAADQNYPVAYVSLAELLEEEKPEKATEYLKKAVAAGVPHAMTVLGSWYENGLGGLPQDTRQALDYYKAAANAGAEEAGYEIHRLYTDDSDAQDYITAKEANHFLHFSAQQGYDEAQYEIFKKSLLNDEQNITKEEFRFLELAAKQHHQKAMNEFAFQLHQKKQVVESKKYYEEAFDLYPDVETDYALCDLPRLATAALHMPKQSLPELILWNAEDDEKYLKKISVEQLAQAATAIAKQSGHLGLQALSVCGNSKAVDIRPLLEALPHFNQLYEIDLAGLFLTHDFLKALFPLLDVHRRLMHLSISGCEINDENAETFAEWLKAHQQLVSLSLLSCVMSATAAQKIFSALQGHSSLITLHVEALNPEGLLPLQKMLNDTKTHLQTIIFDKCDLQKPPVDLMKDLAGHASLTCLTFNQCTFSKKTQTDLIKATKDNTTLKELSVKKADPYEPIPYGSTSWFNVGPSRIEVLTVPEADLKKSTYLLKRNPNLKSLSFSPIDNFKTDKNVAKHATALIKKNQLSDIVLNTEHTDIFRRQDLPELKKALETNPNLRNVEYGWVAEKDVDPHLVDQEHVKFEEQTLIPLLTRNEKKHDLPLSNWKQLCLLMAFVKANSQSQLRTSILPLLDSIIEQSGGITDPKELIRPSRLMDTLFFHKEVPKISKKRKREEVVSEPHRQNLRTL